MITLDDARRAISAAEKESAGDRAADEHCSGGCGRKPGQPCQNGRRMACLVQQVASERVFSQQRILIPP
jgi:hypothetical protein